MDACPHRRHSAKPTDGSSRVGLQIAPSTCWESSRRKFQTIADPESSSHGRGLLRAANSTWRKGFVSASLAASQRARCGPRQRPQPPGPPGKPQPPRTWVPTRSAPPPTPRRPLGSRRMIKQPPWARRSAGNSIKYRWRYEQLCGCCRRSVKMHPVRSDLDSSPRVYFARSSPKSKLASTLPRRRTSATDRDSRSPPDNEPGLSRGRSCSRTGG